MARRSSRLSSTIWTWLLCPLQSPLLCSHGANQAGAAESGSGTRTWSMPVPKTSPPWVHPSSQLICRWEPLRATSRVWWCCLYPSTSISRPTSTSTWNSRTCPTTRPLLWNTKPSRVHATTLACQTVMGYHPEFRSGRPLWLRWCRQQFHKWGRGWTCMAVATLWAPASRRNSTTPTPLTPRTYPGTTASGGPKLHHQPHRGWTPCTSALHHPWVSHGTPASAPTAPYPAAEGAGTSSPTFHPNPRRSPCWQKSSPVTRAHKSV